MSNEREHDGLDARMDRGLMAVARAFEEMHRRLDGLEVRFDAKFSDVFGHFDEVYRRFERLEQEHAMSLEALRRIEATMLVDRDRRQELERRLEGLKRDVAGLQARIEDVERRLQR